VSYLNHLEIMVLLKQRCLPVQPVPVAQNIQVFRQ
jgi:hypothetical protein